ncbi:MAG: DUF4340 domain-containing protein [Myxococcota bacterium]|nr:DUF4340 domain-containing protein [Myxococcota bacterium]
MIGILALTVLSPPPNNEEKKWTNLEELVRSQLNLLTIVYGNQEYFIELSGGTPQWRGHSTPLDHQKVETLVSEIINVSCGDLLNGSNEEYGLTNPEWILKVSGEKKYRTLKIGNKSPFSNHHYLDCDELGGPRLSRNAFSLPSQFTDLIDSDLILINPDAIEKVAFSNNHLIERLEGTWKLVHPHEVILDNAKVSNWLKDIDELDGHKWTGQLSENLEFSLQFEFANQTKELKFGTAYSSSESGDLFSIDDNIFKTLSKMPSDFYSEKLVLRSDAPTSIHLSIDTMKTSAEFNEEWNDSGKLWSILNEMAVKRVLGQTTDAIGELSLQFANSEQIKWTIGQDKEHYLLYSSNEDANLQIKKSVLSPLLVTAQE